MLYSLVDIARQYITVQREVAYLKKMLPLYIDDQDDGADFLNDTVYAIETARRGFEEVQEDDIDTILSNVDVESYHDWLKNKEIL